MDGVGKRTISEGVEPSDVLDSRRASTLGSLSASLVAVALFLNVGDERGYVILGALLAVGLAVAFWTKRVRGRRSALLALGGLVLLPLALDVRAPHRSNPMACDAGQCVNSPSNEVTALVVAVGAIGVVVSAVVARNEDSPRPNHTP